MSPSSAATTASGRGSSSTFTLLSETLLIGVFVALASIPVVTALPAVAAAARHLRRHLAGDRDSFSLLLRDLVLAGRGLWPVAVGAPALMLLLTLNMWLGMTTSLPGGRMVAMASGAAAGAVVVTALRLAGSWSPGSSLPTQVREAARRASRDPVGVLLLVCALGVSAALVWMFLPMLLLVGGLLAFAVLCVEFRYAVRRQGPSHTHAGAAR